MLVTWNGAGSGKLAVGSHPVSIEALSRDRFSDQIANTPAPVLARAKAIIESK